MTGYFTIWVSFGLLSHFLLAIGAAKCSEKETLLMPKPSSMKLPTDCLIECSSMTYEKKLQLRDNHNIRITDSTEGDPGEYCWSSKLKCLTGESFTNAYVVLPVDASAVGNEQLEVKTTGPIVTPLHTNNSPTTIAESCGLIYEVTSHFTMPSTQTSFCVQVVTQENELGDRFLTCPPFMITFWQRNPNQPSQQDLG
ncbi:hypothetical protein ATANTOWER_024512 [Ataeniobius toweri]|uniref:Uncharacterized protein n=1 Tax=Ataeniobius toweri TaxID=208326 RepID=A0ABU7CCZ5_9TELE|nr:hypothetical protein [Ataeniobius toweri]